MSKGWWSGEVIVRVEGGVLLATLLSATNKGTVTDQWNSYNPKNTEFGGGGEGGGGRVVRELCSYPNPSTPQTNTVRLINAMAINFSHERKGVRSCLWRLWLFRMRPQSQYFFTRKCIKQVDESQIILTPKENYKDDISSFHPFNSFYSKF